MWQNVIGLKIILRILNKKGEKKLFRDFKFRRFEIFTIESGQLKVSCRHKKQHTRKSGQIKRLEHRQVEAKGSTLSI